MIVFFFIFNFIIFLFTCWEDCVQRGETVGTSRLQSSLLLNSISTSLYNISLVNGDGNHNDDDDDNDDDGDAVADDNDDDATPELRSTWLKCQRQWCHTWSCHYHPKNNNNHHHHLQHHHHHHHHHHHLQHHLHHHHHHHHHDNWSKWSKSPVHEIPHNRSVWMKRGAVIENQRAASGQCCHLLLSSNAYLISSKIKCKWSLINW